MTHHQPGDLEDRIRDAYRSAERTVQTLQRTSPVLAPGSVRRPRRRAGVLSAGIAVAAAAVAAITLITGSAPPALATVTSALTRTLTQSYHLSEQDSYHDIVNGQIRNRLYSSCATEADPVRHLLTISCSTWNPNTQQAGPVEREVGGYTYFYTPDTTSTHGKHWIRYPTASLLHPCCTENGFTAATPEQMLAEIKAGAEVTVAGPASGPGWTGTRYAFSETLRDKTGLSGTVTVDRQGRTRALALTLRMPSAAGVTVITQVLTFSDFGAPVTVTPPPADQTYPVR